MTKLIEDGRIHPARIEDTYYASKAEIEDAIVQAGEQAVFEANCGEFHEELVKILGRLRYRTSYGQNVLKHTLEVVHLAGIMAAEVGASVKVTKRAALLHDLGKAMTHEVEGSHASISAQLARRYGESQHVVHAIEAHHYEIEPQTVEAVLLISADAISASRPGARGESLEHYIKRLESLEELAAQKPGVEKVYALQAGREIRVIVKPGEVDDDAAVLLSHEIAREIEDQLEYPGQVKVTVIRESRAIDVARNVANGGHHETLAPAEPVPASAGGPGSPSALPVMPQLLGRAPSQRLHQPRRRFRERGRRPERQSAWRGADAPSRETAEQSVSLTSQQAADGPGRQRVERVGDEAEPDEDKTEDERLRPDAAAVGATNCGRNARKKSAVLGLSAFTIVPRTNARRSGSRLRSTRVSASRSSSFRMPR